MMLGARVGECTGSWRTFCFDTTFGAGLAGNALRELGMRDLTFNRTEAGTFLEQTHGLQLAPRELGLLLRHTEGWGAGLQLASLYLKDSHNTKDAIHGLSEKDLDAQAKELGARIQALKPAND